MKKKLLIILFLLLFMLSGASVVYGWFISQTTVDLDFKGSVVTSYFHCGTGEEDDPYVITRPVHLYNLSQLYQLLEDFDTQNYYFQIGYDLDNSGTNKVYLYNDNGEYQNGTLTTTLNMNHYTDFTPIGTVDHPFNGIFDGNLLTINNLHISGDAQSDVGVFGYLGLDANVKNCYFDNLTINVDRADTTLLATNEEHTAHDDNVCYVGYIAGHIETATSLENIYVNNCNISGTGDVTVVNNLGYYGYCEDAMSIEEIAAKAKGEDISWGGSVDMEAMYNRLYSVAGRATNGNNYVYDTNNIYKLDGTTEVENTLTGQAYTYYSEKIGSFVFSSARGNYMYLHGGTTVTPITESRGNQYTGYTISSGTHYLSTDGESLIDSNAANATVWRISGSTIYTVIDGTRYYLHYSTSGWISTTYTLNVSTSSTNWTITNDDDNSQIYYRRNNNIYYIKYNNNAWRMATGSANISLDTQIGYEIIRTEGTSYVDYENGTNTYFPLITNTDYTAANINTGYVVSGSNDRTTSGTYPVKSGDIRVSKYSTSDISNSYSDGALRTVYTIDKNGNRQTVSANNFKKYSESAGKLLDMISSDNIYGLHFMSGLIDLNNIVTANYALINGEEKSNYQLPANSIDFNLLEKGYINFFAGTYFANNNSFFSLHHIERDEETGEITAIKEIKEIYSDGIARHSYIYKYNDNTYSETLTNEYSLIFTTSQIKRQNSLTDNAVYYFEVPVNEGEYALGSVDGGTGAYLMYLDIGTNGGSDEWKTVDNFGSIEYRTSPDTAENSIFLLSYECTNTNNVNISVSYDSTNKRYTVTCTVNEPTLVKLALLSGEYSLDFNGTIYTKVDLYSLLID